MSPDRESAKALVVDDEPHILRALRNALAGEFATVLEAANARDAVDLAAAQRPDVVVLDLGLPDKPGLWVLTELRKWSAVPVIVGTILSPCLRNSGPSALFTVASTSCFSR